MRVAVAEAMVVAKAVVGNAARCVCAAAQICADARRSERRGVRVCAVDHATRGFAIASDVCDNIGRVCDSIGCVCGYVRGRRHGRVDGGTQAPADVRGAMAYASPWVW